MYYILKWSFANMLAEMFDKPNIDVGRSGVR